MDCECAICKNNKPFIMPEEIIKAAINNELVLFCGAGISTEGKNVLPYSFYNSIEKELGIDDNTIPFSELMQMFCNRPNGRAELLRRIRERFQYIHSFPELERQATAFYQELSVIHQINTYITTNWDTYFEDCCGAIPITIPEDFALLDDSSRRVIKLHGSINNLSSIVVTRDDYQKCFESLQKGVIGATLKTILATKTVAFIGYSFGDEDFTQIIDYLRSEMGSIYPHVYFVTLDDTLQDRLNYHNSTLILTSGTFFLHQLKNELVDRGYIVNCDVYPIICELIDEIRELHERVASIDFVKYPSAIYTLSYQDGVIHSWERFVQNYHTGEYNRPGRICLLASSYDEIIERYHMAGDYWNEAYYEGYQNGIILIGACNMDETLFKEFPFLYLPNAKEPLKDYTVFYKELERISKGRSKYHVYAKKIVNTKMGPNLLVHHPPY